MSGTVIEVILDQSKKRASTNLVVRWDFSGKQFWKTLNIRNNLLISLEPTTLQRTSSSTTSDSNTTEIQRTARIHTYLNPEVTMLKSTSATSACASQSYTNQEYVHMLSQTDIRKYTT